MKVEIRNINGNVIALIESDKVLMRNVQEALDVMASIRYNYNTSSFIMDKANISEDFFDLRTKLAGEILQKFVTYGVKFGITGDFSRYESKSLQDFIRECNEKKQIVFTREVDTAIEMLANQ